MAKSQPRLEIFLVIKKVRRILETTCAALESVARGVVRNGSIAKFVRAFDVVIISCMSAIGSRFPVGWYMACMYTCMSLAGLNALKKANIEVPHNGR